MKKESLRETLRPLKKRENVQLTQLEAEELNSSSRRINFLVLWRLWKVPFQKRRNWEKLSVTFTKVKGPKKLYDWNWKNKKVKSFM